MARTITTSAVIWYGATPALVADVVDIKYTSPARSEILSNGLNEDVPNVIGVGARGAYKLVVTVERDWAEAFQIAADAAYLAKTALTTLSYYPDGKTTGLKMISGNVYVTGIPPLGGQGKDKVKSGDYTLVYDGAPTIGLAP